MSKIGKALKLQGFFLTFMHIKKSSVDILIRHENIVRSRIESKYHVYGMCIPLSDRHDFLTGLV